MKSTFELLLILESLYAQLCRAGKWKFEALLLTVALPVRFIIGTDLGHVWWAPVGEEKKLHGRHGRELITKYPSAKPELLLDDPYWRYSRITSAPIALITRKADRNKVRAVVEAALGELEAFRARVEKTLAQLGDEPAWKKCVICSPIPELSFFPPGGEVRSHYLEILGAPLFNDFGSSREWCLKRCPLCATHWLWKSDYEYLVNGATETDITLTRLTDEEAQPVLKAVEERIRAANGLTTI